MKKSFLQTLACLQLVIFSCVNCSKGQVATNGLKDSANAQKPLIAAQTQTQKGRPGSNVHSGLQDKAGNMWFGTAGAGVYKYDGKSFINYTDKDGLSNNFVWCIYEDKNGNLWFGTADGVSRCDGKKFTNMAVAISPIKFHRTDSGMPSEENAVWSILEDNDGRLIFATSQGIFRYDGFAFIHLLHHDGVINNTGFRVEKVEHLLKDKSGDIWFGGRGTEGLFRYNGKSLTNYAPDGKNWLWPLLQDKAGNIWSASRKHSMYRYDGKTFSDSLGRSFFGWVFSMAEDKDGNIWFSTDGGAAKFDGRHLTLFTTKDGLRSNSVFNITTDRSGKVWIGTGNGGLSCYDGVKWIDFTDEK